ncbi:MAG: hypothetical protein BWY10_02122 [Chloroflexi bacterium ADurb.Bin180]|nr:MAG: hypothetical protein BWY10_02122 [Chloroflexi bacterium ADurb.Bin180]
MPTFSDHMSAFHAALQQGSIQPAYSGLLQFLLELRTRFQKFHPEYDVPGTFYSGYLDMSYFAIVTPALRPRKLKLALVFVYETFRFEIWLSGVNRAVQEHYYHLIKDSGWKQYDLVPEIKGSDAILTHVLAQEPDWSDLPALANRLESGTLTFIRDVEAWVTKQNR